MGDGGDRGGGADGGDGSDRGERGDCSGVAAAAAGTDPGRARLAWRCRRGRLELDLLLQRWLQRRYESATPQQRALFAALLELPDPLLAAYLMGAAGASPEPLQPALQALIEAIRSG
ncbi:MAG TPA: succinate dehydrogenase assembly factor 2 [Steroidobacteraceae bacterium]|nr:succinate dehydrogenase assembly factor 2 [Steroidobacteraceae bacterium]